MKTIQTPGPRCSTSSPPFLPKWDNALLPHQSKNDMIACSHLLPLTMLMSTHYLTLILDYIMPSIIYIPRLGISMVLLPKLAHNSTITLRSRWSILTYTHSFQVTCYNQDPVSPILHNRNLHSKQTMTGYPLNDSLKILIGINSYTV